MEFNHPMTLDDYEEVYDAIIHLAGDIESDVPRPYEHKPTEETLKKYSYLREMIECLNDVPKSALDFTIKQGIKIPEIYDL